MIRMPAVAGSFYPEHPDQLRDDVAAYLRGGQQNLEVKGLVVPHAGYIYSGAIAAQAYKSILIPPTVLLFGPDHHGSGTSAAVYSSGSWRTPLGDVPINEALAAELIAACPLLKADTLAHRHEHAIEVQIPFLQSIRPDVRIVPISLGHAGLDDWLFLGQQIGELLTGRAEKALLIASSDLHHFSSAATTEMLDRSVINMMERYDPAGLYSLVRENRISMCGVIPTIVMLTAARVSGATNCRLQSYGHSGMVNGDLQSVVGYACLLVD